MVPSVESAQFIASLLQRAPRRFCVMRTGKALCSTSAAMGSLSAACGAAAPSVNLPLPVTTHSP